ncbi:phosphotriesterase [Maribellus sp. YY47]|uniref:phosphotriesterase family protein n=1 Tax=Maribellus sp. YY47 TaxID=2929486 RepID=UPI002001720A|nr:phosphotriesterase [Maribellus sp. YY47]MCK3684490.1 phosphotriesterase [Maribellus sp. YY47]
MTRASSFILIVLFISLISCRPEPPDFMTVTGPVSVKKMGKTLHHEHILVDFIGADSTGYHRWNREEVVKKVLPYLLEARDLGYKTIMECTPAFLGRDPELLKMLSEKTGMYFVTNTGLYSAYDGKYIPEELQKKTAEELAALWIDEAKNGIEGTGVYPGFIKISVNPGPLSELNRKVVEASCITHKATGLVIMSHTGPAIPAFEQLEILKKYGVDPSAFIWTHANNEKDREKLLEAARMGVFIAFDGFAPDKVDEYLDFILYIKKHGQLPQVLLSHDAGWYSPGEPDGGDFRGYSDIETYLVPAMEKAGIAQFDLFQLFFRTPADAFRIRELPVQQ